MKDIKMMIYLLLLINVVCSYHNKVLYNPANIYYKHKKIDSKQDKKICKEKLPDYVIPDWVYKKVFKENKKKYYY